jgi:hypothetical protein
MTYHVVAVRSASSEFGWAEAVARIDGKPTQGLTRAEAEKLAEQWNAEAPPSVRYHVRADDQNQFPLEGE